MSKTITSAHLKGGQFSRREGKEQKKTHFSSFPLTDIHLKNENEIYPPPRHHNNKKFGCKAQCNEVPYKSNHSEMLAYLDNHVREIGGKI